MSAPKLALHEPLERLNYYNSQRLEAVDFRLEQAYHMRVRRELNRALYSSGIGAGLEVLPDPDDPHAVVVGEGLALDRAGREVILSQPRKVKVCGTPRRADGVTFGNYLVIAYREEKVAPVNDGCAVPGVPSTGAGGCSGKATPATRTNACGGQCHGGCGCGGTCGGGPGGSESYAWGAPSRIRSEPLLMFQNDWPTEGSGKILLAQVELSETCTVLGIKTGMRRYVTATKPPVVVPLSLAGEKDIDEKNPKVLHFHIDGGFPDTVRLFLAGAKFSSLYYTELGRHTHDIHASTDKPSVDLKHSHALVDFKVKDHEGHRHELHMQNEGNVLESQGGVDSEDRDWDDVACSNSGAHGHALEVLTLDERLSVFEHGHVVTANADDAGVSNVPARDGQAALGYLKNLRVAFTTGNSTQDITSDVLAQLQAIDPGNWAELGNGNAAHPINTRGTPAIDLRQVPGIDLGPGAHALVFSVPAGTGGQVHFNLYVS